ncbi:olfactory receptor 1E16-like [Discoglossus pictus]
MQDDNMLMDNHTSYKNFHLLGFSSNGEKQPLLFSMFFLIYITGILGNIIIIIAVYMDSNLHIPMYIFLGNLSFADICFTTVTMPKLMNTLLSKNNSISIMQCFTQMFFFLFLGDADIFLLSSMAYDRYIAICHPLHYHMIMNKDKCIMFLISTWMSACGNSLFLTGFISFLSFCRSNEIQHFCCDPKAMIKISCAETVFYIILYVETCLFGLLPFLLSLISYQKIINCILKIKSTDGRRKAFSTCTSHLTVLTVFYGTVVCTYAKPPSEHIDTLDQLFAVLFAAVTPMLNPLMYSLRNKEIKSAITRLNKSNY